MSNWFADGHPLSAIDPGDRSVQYGDGLFETIAIRNGAARLWERHVARLQTGCERLGLTCPASDVLHRELNNALAGADVSVEFATAKIIVAAANGERGYRRPAGAAVSLRVGIFSAQKLPEELYRDGVRTRLCSTRLALQPQLAGIKTLNRLEQVLARAEWSDLGVFDGLMLDTADRLICGTMSNVFIVSQSKLQTPGLTRCGVSGVMRAHVIGLLQNAGIECQVDDLPRDQLFAADEVFLSNSQFGVLPLRSCDNRTWEPGPITRMAQQLACQHDFPECDV